MINETIFNTLNRLLSNLDDIKEAVTLKADGYMDLNVDILERTGDYILMALNHYHKDPSGDTIANPDIEVKVYPSRKMAEAMTYQDSFGYQQVYHDFDPETGEYSTFAPRVKKELNSFLNKWLGNLLLQGHKPKAVSPRKGSPQPLYLSCNVRSRYKAIIVRLFQARRIRQKLITVLIVFGSCYLLRINDNKFGRSPIEITHMIDFSSV